jgi:DNA-binding response OmpR family regulator
MAGTQKNRKVSVPPGKRSSLPPGRKKLVMVVEDDPALRALIVRALSPSYDVVQAEDGLAASELLGAARQPDLVLCDVMMPRVDGFTFAKMMRGHKELARIPLIFVTAKTGPANVVQGLGLGAKHYIQKPFSVKELLEKVKKLL